MSEPRQCKKMKQTYSHLLIQSLNIFTKLWLQRNHSVFEHIIVPKNEQLL